MTTPKPTIHTFTPDEARRIYDATVAAGTNNPRSRQYANALTAGQWRWHEADPIRLSSDGTLCSNGVHRLLACAQSGVPLQSLVLYGDEWRGGLHTDRGMGRTVTQYAAHAGIANASQKVALVNGHLSRLAAVREGVTAPYARTVFLQDGDTIEYIEKNDDALGRMCARSGTAAVRGFNRTGYAVFMWQCHMIDDELADDYHADFVNHDSDAADPLTVLRRWASVRLERTARHLSQTATIDNLIKAWNHRMNGDTLTLWRPAAWTDVRFPAGWPGA
jgi:hypothetical protein